MQGQVDDPLTAESRRLTALAASGLLDAPQDEQLDGWVDLAAQLLGFPIVAINLVDERRQWTLAAVGMCHGDEADRGDSFCARAIQTPTQTMVVEDASQDPRFVDNAMVADGLRFYAGAPLVDADGLALGTLCVADTRPRHPTAQQLATLRALARAVSTEVELRTLLDERDREREDLAELGRFTRRLARSTSLDELQASACRAALRIARADGAHLLLRDADGGLSSRATSDGVPRVRLAPEDRTVTQEVLRSGRAAFIADIATDPRVTATPAQRASAASAAMEPLGQHADGSAAGVLAVFWNEPQAELPERVRRLLATLADEVAVALERTSLLERLDALARTDELTGLPNRRVLDEALARELSRASRDGSPVTLALLDLDRFKAFNDEHGHPAGDRLLAEAAAAWRGSLREIDTLARYGGEEFALLLPACGETTASGIVERVRRAIPAGQTCSAGIAQWDGGESAAALLARADAALYRAKAAGRDVAVWASAA